MRPTDPKFFSMLRQYKNLIFWPLLATIFTNTYSTSVQLDSESRFCKYYMHPMICSDIFPLFRLKFIWEALKQNTLSGTYSSLVFLQNLFSIITQRTDFLITKQSINQMKLENI